MRRASTFCPIHWWPSPSPLPIFSWPIHYMLNFSFLSACAIIISPLLSEGEVERHHSFHGLPTSTVYQVFDNFTAKYYNILNVLHEEIWDQILFGTGQLLTPAFDHRRCLCVPGPKDHSQELRSLGMPALWPNLRCRLDLFATSIKSLLKSFVRKWTERGPVSLLEQIWWCITKWFQWYHTHPLNSFHHLCHQVVFYILSIQSLHFKVFCLIFVSVLAYVSPFRTRSCSRTHTTHARNWMFLLWPDFFRKKETNKQYVFCMYSRFLTLRTPSDWSHGSLCLHLHKCLGIVYLHPSITRTSKSGSTFVRDHQRLRQSQVPS